MSEIAQFLRDNYYGKYKEIPEPDDLELCLELFRDKIIVIRDNGISGVAVYLTLTDASYEKIQGKTLDAEWVKEHGKNIHFIILAAGTTKTILKGLRAVVKKERPKTISWWNPTNTEFHKRTIRREYE